MELAIRTAMARLGADAYWKTCWPPTAATLVPGQTAGPATRRSLSPTGSRRSTPCSASQRSAARTTTALGCGHGVVPEGRRARGRAGLHVAGPGQDDSPGGSSEHIRQGCQPARRTGWRGSGYQAGRAMPRKLPGGAAAKAAIGAQADAICSRAGRAAPAARTGCRTCFTSPLMAPAFP